MAKKPNYTFEGMRLKRLEWLIRKGATLERTESVREILLAMIKIYRERTKTKEQLKLL